MEREYSCGSPQTSREDDSMLNDRTLPDPIASRQASQNHAQMIQQPKLNRESGENSGIKSTSSDQTDHDVSERTAASLKKVIVTWPAAMAASTLAPSE